MLQIKSIRKTYQTGALIQEALDGVSLNFRDNEFVAILGPSGSGKTTLLNIVGGLDRYDSGDLIINGISTKQYGDRDWDAYRNHSIGFVFQSYNLISHQSVLANVELALTISGISKAERRRRATEALEKVGLGDQLHKKPNQMSGGQMQRVAIARALVNDPEILLADEPTGALDTQTGIQVMELLKEVAKDRLVIMVTHNPELAEEYANRIVKLRDGQIVSDSNPLADTEIKAPKTEKQKRASMSFFTSLGLSFNNLLTKKGRTLMTATAGSIGIIGIALILALSSGVSDYIGDLQKSTMSSYPITISSTSMDITVMMANRDSMIGQMMGQIRDDHEPESGIHSNSTAMMLESKVTSALVENNLTAFKRYLDAPDSEIHDYIGENGVSYTYDTLFHVYATDTEGNYLNTDRELDGENSSNSLFGTVSGNLTSGSISPGNIDPTSMLSLMMGSSSETSAENFAQMLPGTDGSLVSSVVTNSYDVLYGTWPQAYNEVVLVLDSNNALSTSVLCQLGLITDVQYLEIVSAIEGGAEEVDEITLHYADAVGKEFRLVTYCDYFLEEDNGLFQDTSASLEGLRTVIENGLPLKIAGIVRANEDAAISISAAIGYPAALTDYVIQHTNTSAVILAQEASPDVDVLTGRSFGEVSSEVKKQSAIDYLSGLGISDKARMYMLMMYSMQTSAGTDTSDTTQTSGMTGGMTMDEAQMAGMMEAYLAGNPDETFLLSVYDSYLGDGSYEDNMAAFGKVSYDAPNSISIYCDTFDDKEAVADCITRYNETVPEDEQITYTDYVAMMTSTITSIVDVISYVLIAFVAVSLIVSCIMISIITQISVMERTKEIGILRAIGASKGNISQVFNAETFIIGITSGMIGVGVSALLTIPINAVIHMITGNEGVNAVLSPTSAATLVLISIVITVISGLIPAKNAAKKDPVVALRTE